MNELLSNIFLKYGIRALLGFLLVVIIIWILAHNMSAPGERVSVVWGLVEYTKPQANSSIITKPISNKSNAVVSTPALTPIEQSKKEAISIFFQNLQKTNVNISKKKLRDAHSLRALTPLESGKNIGETPKGTYFYTLDRWLDIDDGVYEKEIENFEARSKLNSSQSLEVHHSHDEQYYLVGFVSKTHATEVSELSGSDMHIITLSETWHQEFPSLVRLPASRILTAYFRELDMPEELLGVLDITLE